LKVMLVPMGILRRFSLVADWRPSCPLPGRDAIHDRVNASKHSSLLAYATAAAPISVMPALVAGIHALLLRANKHVDGRDVARP